MPTLTEQAATLRANLNNLNERDQAFAFSLLGAFGSRRGASDKQAHWIGVLAERATKPAEAVEKKTVAADVSGILALFDRAAAKLQRPAVVISSPEAGEVRISLATERSREPGTLLVTSNHKSGADFYGRVRRDGEWVASPRIPSDLKAPVETLLTRFAAEPAAVATMHGRATGVCSFCARDLTDERSVAAGYGPVCAQRWGLDRPTRDEAREQLRTLVAA